MFFIVFAPAIVIYTVQRKFSIHNSGKLRNLRSFGLTIVKRNASLKSCIGLFCRRILNFFH